MTKTIAVFNQKGGVGKTTTVINFASALSKMGKKVLICDIDSQANATSGLGISPGEQDKNIYQVLLGNVSARETILPTKIENVHILPSTMDLVGLESEVTRSEERNSILKKALQELRSAYNYILIDCPPSLSLLTVNALVAADELLIPIQCEYYALEGLTQLFRTLLMIKNYLNPAIVVDGIILTMADKRTNLSNQVIQDVKEHLGDLVFQTVIPRNIKLAEAPSFGKAIFDYDSNSTGAKAYWELAEEFIKRQE